MSMGRNVRLDPSTLNPDSVPGGLSQTKIAEIQKGAEEKDLFPIFPRERRWQDLVWLGLFIFSVIVTWGFGIACFASLSSDMDPEAGATPAPAVAVMPPKGETCNSIGAVVPDSQQACENAASQLGLSDTSAGPPNGWNVNNCFGGIYPRCSYYEDSLLYNPNCGDGKANLIAQWICMTSTVQVPSDNPDDLGTPSASVIASAIVVSGGVSFLTSLGFIFLAAKQPACVVWTSLVFGPVFMIFTGLGMLVFGGSLTAQIIGGITIMMGALAFALVFCCYRHLVPFMIAVTELIADVIQHHPCMITVGMIGAFLGIFWTVSAMLSFAAIFAHYRTDVSTDSSFRYPAIFIVVLMFTWGAGVVNNICHVTYCGVFGRWYYCINSSDRDSSGSEGVRVYDPDSPTLWPSFKVAITTSLGSICCGSFLVAAVRALEQVIKQGQADQAQEGNTLVCIILCCLQCIIRCIGDILEYFNDWAYVQCAVRGVSFINAARITFAMFTLSNVKYIIMDLLLDSLVNMGSLIVAIMSCLAGAGVGAIGGSSGASWGAIIGLLIGGISGSAAMGIINSGVKTIFACYADDPQPFEEHHASLTDDFNTRLGKNLGKAEAAQKK